MLSRTSTYISGIMLMIPVSLPAWSAPEDVLQPYLATTYTWYSNLFLVPPDTPPNTPGILDSQRSDRAQQVEAGFNFSKMVGLQNIVAVAKFAKTDFDHFTQLDYFGRDLLLDWDWKLNNVMDGKLGATDTRKLASYTDFHLQERNIIDEQTQFASADLLATPSWRIHAGLSRQKSDYELPVQQLLNNTADTKEAGLSYLTADQNSAGFLFRHVLGNYPNYLELNGAKVDNSFIQSEYDANVDWHLSEKTEIVVLGGWVKRESNLLTNVNVEGLTGRVGFNWQPTQKLKFNVSSWREYDPVQTGQIGYSLNTGVSTEAAWDATGKINLAAKISHERRAIFEFINSAATADYDDRTTDAALTGKYQPRQYLTITAMLTHELRSATIPYEGYLGNEASISVNLKF